MSLLAMEVDSAPSFAQSYTHISHFLGECIYHQTVKDQVTLHDLAKAVEKGVLY